MITSETLLQEAKERGLPVNKKRALVREYLQALMLNAIFKSPFGDKLYFAGGTALRFIYDLPRFSEDLDFNAKGLKPSEFDKLLLFVKSRMENEGFEVAFRRKDIYDVFSARFNFTKVISGFGFSDSRGSDILIKLETNVPSWKIKSETVAVNSFGQLFTAQIMEKGSFLAEKSHAFLRRCRGRDVYDIIFQLKNKFPIDEEMFKAKKIDGTPKEALLKKFESLKTANMKSLVNQVRPFLFKEEEIELVEKAAFYGPELLKKY